MQATYRMVKSLDYLLGELGMLLDTVKIESLLDGELVKDLMAYKEVIQFLYEKLIQKRRLESELIDAMDAVLDWATSKRTLLYILEIIDEIESGLNFDQACEIVAKKNNTTKDMLLKWCTHRLGIGVQDFSKIMNHPERRRLINEFLAQFKQNRLERAIMKGLTIRLKREITGKYKNHIKTEQRKKVEKPKRKFQRLITHEQYISTFERCPECQSILKTSFYGTKYCPKCGWRNVPYYDKGPRESVTSDHWDGVIDNIEKILEDRISRGDF